jgi:lipopolysaccharide transport system permease protein
VTYSLPQILRFAAAYAAIDIRNSFRRSHLGTLWRSLGVFAMIGLLGAFFWAILKEYAGPFQTYILALGAGVLIWELLSMTLNQCCSVFSSQAQSLRHTRQPLAGLFLRIALRNFFIFVQSAVIGILIYAAVWGVIPSLSWQLLPGVMLTAIGVFALGIIVGTASIRFRDLPQLVSWITHIWFLLTPILWPAGMLGRYEYLNIWNPGYHFVELFRAPLTAQTIQPVTWAAAGATTALLVFFAIALLRRYEKRVPFWL